MDAVDVLMEARAYIEKGWCQGSLALAGSRKVEPNDQNAEKWCVIGAIYKGAGGTQTPPGAFGALFEAIGPKGPSGHPAHWNDAPERTHEEALELMDKAIGIALERAGER